MQLSQAIASKCFSQPGSSSIMFSFLECVGEVEEVVGSFLISFANPLSTAESGQRYSWVANIPMVLMPLSGHLCPKLVACL